MDANRSIKDQQRIHKVAAIPIFVLLAVLLHSQNGLTWSYSAWLGLALGTTAQLITVPSWYACRIAPISTTPVWKILTTHFFAAQILSLLWLICGILISRALGYAPALHAIDSNFVPKELEVYFAGNVLYLLSIALHYVWMAQEASRDFERRAMQTSLQARDAELRALKAQINPHFLFNSLNSISALTSIDPTRARSMCILLGDFLRLTLGLGEKTLIRFSEELELLEKYLAIEQVRFGNRLKIHTNIQEDAKACVLPPLLLQPLVENAVKHGIANLAEGGDVRLAATRQNGHLLIHVENSWDPDAPPSRSSGVGLKNVQRRLEARYGKDASILVNTQTDLFQVDMDLPAESELPT